jgi:hypothetical protein
VDPDERYGFAAGLAPISDVAPAIDAPPTIEVVALDGIPLEGTTVSVHGTSVTMGPGAPYVEPSPVILEPRAVTGPSQTEG